MLTGIQEFTPKPLAVSDAPKPPAPAEEFSVPLDQATLQLLLDHMTKLGIDTSKLKISSEQPAPANGSGLPPAVAGPPATPAARLKPLEPLATPGTTTTA